jgi:NADP-dependent 3-hydroxy acid dehydrogenase YdfG
MSTNDQVTSRNRETIALIAGGTQGLGLEIARKLAKEGADGIIISGRIHCLKLTWSFGNDILIPMHAALSY